MFIIIHILYRKNAMTSENYFDGWYLNDEFTLHTPL